MSKYKCLECLDCRELLYGWNVNDRCPNCGGELQEAYSDNKKELAKGNLSKKEFKEMCQKAGIKKESLCKTVFTKNL